MLTVDLIIPALNEEVNMAPLLAQLHALDDQTSPVGRLRRIILVDNGSTDRTAELAGQHGAVVVREPRRGYGSACLAGLAYIEQDPEAPDAVAFLDADLADDPAHLPTLWAPIASGRADFVLGARHTLARPGALDAHQRFGNWLSCWLLRWTTGKHYRDLGPMRVIRWPTLLALDMRDRTWGWTVEMQFKAAKKKLAVMEIDTPYRKRRAGESKISGSVWGSVRAGVKILTTIARLTWRG